MRRTREQNKNMLRKYQIASEGEDTFALIFDHDGRMFVERYKDSKEAHNKRRVTHIAPDNFDKFKVGHISLKEVVVKKLQAILR